MEVESSNKMGEYLHLTTVEGIQYRKNPQSVKSSIKKVDRRLKQLIDTDFKDFPRLQKELYVQDGEIETKLGVCEECFFNFKEMVTLYKFIKKHSKYLIYGERQQYNCPPEEFLKCRGSLYMGGFDRWQTYKKTKKVLITKYVKQLEHSKVWRRYEKVTSKTGKRYYKKIAKSQTFGNSNGKQFPCPNSKKKFLAYPSGFAWDYKTNKGRNLFNCPKCRVTFNQGEFHTPQYKWLSDELKKVPQPFKSPRMLPTITAENGKIYFVDKRLNQLRNVKNRMTT